DLAGEVERIGDKEWVAHYNTGDYEGSWSGVALRGVDGRADRIHPDPSAIGRFRDTTVLNASPAFRSVLDVFECELSCVRLLKLAAGSRIKEHRDVGLSAAYGEARIHVPILSHDDVEFFLDGEVVPMQVGEAWYLDLELPHRVDNRSDLDRVHLVIDCVVDDWLEELLRAGRPDMSDPSLSSAVPLDRVDSESLRAPRPRSTLADPTAATIVAFLVSIGLEVVDGDVGDDCIVPGVRIDGGVIVVDEARLRHPGDLLHEAGHLAVTEPARRTSLSGDAESDGGDEMAAIAWSYAAAQHLGIDPAVVFHEAGYRGGSASILENFAAGRFFGVPLLQWYEMTYDEVQASSRGVAAYPAMCRWLREEKQVSDD
ncbi:MAG: aspartyl/asparaginyl beta-hydroxylase domain-containing protein, partial [Ilumatobacter sp.]